MLIRLISRISLIKTYMKDQNGFGYEKLIVYWLATSIYDLTVIFVIDT